jgi:hypothetical protein
LAPILRRDALLYFSLKASLVLALISLKLVKLGCVLLGLLWHHAFDTLLHLFLLLLELQDLRLNFLGLFNVTFKLIRAQKVVELIVRVHQGLVLVRFHTQIFVRVQQGLILVSFMA